ncbi:MAG: hypothetical protein WCC48_15985 [Anaeromyxobacteraceae bacterium]
MAVYHVIVDGAPACTSPVIEPDERLEPPICGTRNRARADDYAAMLRSRHPEARVEVVEQGCPMRGE